MKQIEFRIERDLCQENGEESSPPSSTTDPSSATSSPTASSLLASSSSLSSRANFFSLFPPPTKIMDIVLFMREQRRGMVQTKEQYSFIYRVAEDALESLLKNGISVMNENWKNEGRAAAAFLNGDGDVDPEEHGENSSFPFLSPFPFSFLSPPIFSLSFILIPLPLSNRNGYGVG